MDEELAAARLRCQRRRCVTKQSRAERLDIILVNAKVGRVNEHFRSRLARFEDSRLGSRM